MSEPSTQNQPARQFSAWGFLDAAGAVLACLILWSAPSIGQTSGDALQGQVDGRVDLHAALVDPRQAVLRDQLLLDVVEEVRLTDLRVPRSALHAQRLGDGGATLAFHAVPKWQWWMLDAGIQLASDEGIYAAPEGAACVAALRKRLGMSQPVFAHMFGLSVGTIRDWEQGRCQPDGRR